GIRDRNVTGVQTCALPISIVFVGYTPDGFDLFQMPYPGSTSASTSLVAPDFSPAPASALAATTPPAATGEPEAHATRQYTPLPTLKPTSWSPIFESDREQTRVGAATSGFDVLGYHTYIGWATWLVSSPAGA